MLEVPLYEFEIDHNCFGRQFKVRCVGEDCAGLSEGGGHAVDDVAQDLLEPGEPVGDLPEPPVSQGALHAVARTCGEIFKYCG